MSTWLSVWARAVIEPAWRRALAVWVGAAIVGAIVFGPTGMHPHDLTAMAIRAPGAGGVLAATWLLLFLPTARVIVHADAARFLRALPGPALTPWLVGASALIGFQAPWVVLWVIGDGLRGAGLVAALSAVIVLVARWRPRAARPSHPAWRHPGAALRGVYVRALRRRAGDALVRGVGLAILAGGTAGLVVRNNQLTGAHAATLSAAVLSIVLVPATVGPAIVLLEAHRQSGWLAASLGVSRTTQRAALVISVGFVHVGATAIALTTTAVVLRDVASPSTIGAIVVTGFGAAVGATLGNARVMLAAILAPSVATRVAVGAVVVAAMIVLWLGLLGVAGIAAILATALLGLMTVPA